MSSIIEVSNLSKSYQIGERQNYLALRDSVAQFFKHPQAWWKSRLHKKEFWALRDVNFTVERGDILGIVGRNGAGKSTLLKILSQITPPTCGEIRLRGRVGSLLEVGTGFHPELTGRENIFLNGAILGMRKKEIERKFDEIVAFSGVEEFLDTPVKRYSSGMYVRLAFAVAAHLEPEILLVDEVLAVGDAEFQKKCLGKMQEVTEHDGRTVLFVSHNMGAIQSLCPKSIYMSEGSVKQIDRSEVVIDQYLKDTLHLMSTPVKNRTDRTGSGELRITNCYFQTDDGHPTSQLISGQGYKLVFEFEVERGKKLSHVTIGSSVLDQFGLSLFLCHNQMTKTEFGNLAGSGKFTCFFPRVPLVPGSYTINVRVTEGGRELDYLTSIIQFEVLAGDFFGTGMSIVHSKVYVDHAWSVSLE